MTSARSSVTFSMLTPNAAKLSLWRLPTKRVKSARSLPRKQKARLPKVVQEELTEAVLDAEVASSNAAVVVDEIE